VDAGKILRIAEEDAEDFVVKERPRSIKYPVVQPELCTACRDCMDVCPANCINIKNGKAFVNENDCGNCRICVTACPVNAFIIK
jgi:NAD-dependent dihydropyrimidine dehydrogenase PreA subunit